MGKYKTDLFLAFFFVIVETSVEMFIPFVMADVIDLGVAEKNMPMILHKGAQMILLTVISFAAGMIYARFVSRAAYGFGASLRDAEYKAVQSYSFGDLDSFTTSSLVTRLTNDTTVIQNVVINGLRPAARSPIMMILGIILAFRINSGLAGVFFVLLPILSIAIFLIVRKIAPLYNRMQKAVDSVNMIVQEDLLAIRAIKSFVREDYEEEKFGQVNKELKNVSVSAVGTAVLNQPVFQATLYAAIVLIMWLGGNMMIKGTLKVGELTGVLSYAMQIMNSVMMLSATFLLISRSLASTVRIGEVLERIPEIQNTEEPVKEVKDGSIDFEKVSFKYGKNAAEYALENVTFHIHSGQTVGIIGTTGSSKTTLVQLIPRLYDTTCGVVKVGGTDVRKYDQEVLHDAVGMVLQKNLLFSGSILDNLEWGDPDAEEADIRKALRISCSDEFIDHFPEGLNTEMGQGGVNVSGGQKQRLCIARAILKKPKILILDDAVSAVDTATEQKIREELSKITGMTKIIIAQRVGSVMHADQIIILEDGRVHAVGTHDSLLKTDPVYQEIWNTQKGSDSESSSEEAAGEPVWQK